MKRITIQDLDRAGELLDECLTVSELLWDSEDVDPETSQRAGVMLTKKIYELKELHDKKYIGLVNTKKTELQELQS